MNRQFWAIVLIFGSVFFLYGKSISFPFLWDDATLVCRNKLIQNPTVELVLRPTFPNHPGSPFYYRPAQSLTYALDFQVWNWSPAGFHLTNILLHAIGVILFFLLLQSISGASPGWPLFFSLIYAAHPVHVGTVAYVSGRGDLLCSIGLLGMLWAFLRKHSLLSLLFLALALGSMEMGFVGPVLLLALALHQSQWKWRGIDWKRLFPFFALTVFFLLIRAFFQRGAWGFVSPVPWVERVSVLPILIVEDIGILLAPVHPHLFHEMAGFPKITLGVWLAFLVAAGTVLAFFAVCFKKMPESRFALYWMAAARIPTLGILFPLAHRLAEHWLTVVFQGFCFFIFWIHQKTDFGRKRRWLFTGLLLLWASGLVFSTARYLQRWNNAISLMEYTLALEPGYHELRVGYSSLLLSDRRSADAMEQSAQAIHCGCWSAEVAWSILSKASLSQGKIDQAIWAAENGLRSSRPWDGYASSLALSLIYFYQKEFYLAEKWARNALLIKPDYSLAEDMLHLIAKEKSRISTLDK